MSSFSPQLSLVVEDLRIMRGNAVICKGLTFHLNAQQGIYLKGPNGCGKSTLLKTLFGALRPIQGHINIQPTPSKAIAYMAADRVEPTRMSIQKIIAFWYGLLGDGANVPQLLHKWNLEDLKELPFQALSAGQKKRLLWILIEMQQRPIWVLDEPFAALDEAGRQLGLTAIKAHLASNGIAIVAEHDWPPLEGLQTLTFTAP